MRTNIVYPLLLLGAFCAAVPLFCNRRPESVPSDPPQEACALESYYGYSLKDWDKRNERQLVFANNPEGVLPRDLADNAGRSLFHTQLNEGNFAFFSSHVNFTPSELHYDVVLKNEGTLPVEVVVTRSAEFKGVEGAYTLENALRVPHKVEKAAVLNAGQTLTVHQISSIKKRSFFHVYSHFDIKGGPLIIEEKAFYHERAVKRPLREIHEDETLKQVSGREREPRTHKGFAEYSELSLPEMDLSFTSDRETPRLTWTGSGGPSAEPNDLCHNTSWNFFSNTAASPLLYHHDQASATRANSGAWGATFSYSLNLRNGSNEPQELSHVVEAAATDTRFAYKVTEAPAPGGGQSSTIVPWTAAKLSSGNEQLQLFSTKIAPGVDKRVEVTWILGAPSYADLKHHLTVCSDC